MPTGFGRTTEVLGLHPKPCRRCAYTSERVVTRREAGLFAAGIPILTLQATWTTCSGCARARAVPLLSFGTFVTFQLAFLFMIGAGWLSWASPAWWLAAAIVAGTYALSALIARALTRRVVPVPAALQRAMRRRPLGRLHLRRRRRNRALL